MSSQSSSDTDEEDANPQLLPTVPLSPYYTDVISDDSDGECSMLASLYNVMTPLHVPGRHRLTNRGQSVRSNDDGVGDNKTYNATAQGNEEPHTDSDGDHISLIKDKILEEQSMCKSDLKFDHEVNPLLKEEDTAAEANSEQETKSDESIVSDEKSIPESRTLDDAEVTAVTILPTGSDHVSLTEGKIQEEQNMCKSDLKFDHEVNPLLKKEDTAAEANGEQETKPYESIVSGDKSIPESRILDDAEVPAVTILPTGSDYISLTEGKIQEEQRKSDLEFENEVLKKEDTSAEADSEQEIESDDSIDETTTPESGILRDAEVPATTTLIPDGDNISLIEDKIQEELRKSDLKFDHDANREQETKSDESVLSDDKSTPDSGILGDSEVPAVTTLIPERDHISLTEDKNQPEQRKSDLKFDHEANPVLEQKDTTNEAVNDQETNSDDSIVNDEKSSLESRNFGNTEVSSTSNLKPENLKPANGGDLKTQPIGLDSIDIEIETTTVNLLDETEKGSQQMCSVRKGEKEQSDSETEAVVKSAKGNGENDVNNSHDGTDCTKDEQNGIDEAMDIQTLEEHSESDSYGRNEQSENHIPKMSSMPHTFYITDTMMADLPDKESTSISSSSEFCIIEKTHSLDMIEDKALQMNTKSNDPDTMSETEHDVADTKVIDDYEDDISHQKFKNSFDSDAVSVENEEYIEVSSCKDNDSIADNEKKEDKKVGKNEKVYQGSDDEYQSAEEGEYMENIANDKEDSNNDEKEDYRTEKKEEYQQENQDDGDDTEKFKTSFVDLVGNRKEDLEDVKDSCDSFEETVLQKQSDSSSIIVLSRDNSIDEFQSESSKIPSREFIYTGSIPLSDKSQTSKIEDFDECQSTDKDKAEAESSFEVQDVCVFSINLNEMGENHTDLSSCSGSPSTANSSERQDYTDFTKEIVSVEHIENKVSDDESSNQHPKQGNRIEKYVKEKSDESKPSNSSVSAKPPPIPPKSMQVLEHLASLKISDKSQQSIVKGDTDKILKGAEKDDNPNTVSVSNNASELLYSGTKSDVETSSPKLPPRRPTSLIQSSLPSTQTPVSSQSSIYPQVSQTSSMQQPLNYPYTTQEQMNYMFQSLSPEQQQFLYNMYCWQVAQSQGQPFVPAQQPAPSDVSSNECFNNNFDQNAFRYEQSSQVLWEPQPYTSPNLKATPRQIYTKESKADQGFEPGSHFQQGQQRQQENVKQQQAQTPLKHHQTPNLKPTQKNIQGQEKKNIEVSEQDTAQKSDSPVKGPQNLKPKPSSRRDLSHSPKPSPRKTGNHTQDLPVLTPRKRSSQAETKSSTPTQDHMKSPEKDPVQKKDNFAGLKTESKIVYEEKEKISPEAEPKPEKCFLYITGMNPKTSSENIFNYLEGGPEDQIIQDPIKQQALIVFSERPDMDKLYHKVQSKPIDGKHLNCQEISPPTCIAVSFDAPISLDNLVLYFESKGNGGGPVVDQVMESEDGSCYFLKFEDPKAVERVCNRTKPHIFGSYELRVSPYYTFEDRAIWDHEIHPIPQARPVDLKPLAEKFRFLKRCCLEQLKAKVVERHGQLELSSDGLKVNCTMTPRLQGFKTKIKEWHDEMVGLIEGFIEENIKERCISLADELEVWTRLLQAETLEDTESFNICQDSSRCQIQLTGFEDDIHKKHDEILQKVERIRYELRRTSKTKKFKELKLGVLVAMGKFGELQEELAGVKIEKDNTAITVEGQDYDIQTVFERIYETLSKISEDSKKHKYSKACVQFVKAQRGIMSKIQQAVDDRNVSAMWDLQDMELKIACPDQFEPTEVANIILSKIDEKTIKLDREMKDVLETEDWTNFCADEVENCQDECHIQSDKTVVVYGYAESVSIVSQHIETFFDENTVRRLDISMDPVSLQFIREFCGEKVREIEQTNESQNVALRLRKEDSKVEIYGKKAGRHAAKKALENLAKTVVSDTHKIDKIGIKHVFAVEKTKGTIFRIEKETRCLIQSDFDADAGRFLPDESVYSTISHDGAAGFESAEEATEDSLPVPETKDFKCKNGIVISQIEGEIGKQSADVLVASCSPNLDLNLGGASRSLLKHGGSGLQDELTKNQTGIKSGELVVLSGAQLECNSVFLTALPQWSSDNTSLALIQKFMTECLQRLAKMKKRSIIFSVLGTGQLKYPSDQVAQTMYQTVIDFDNKTPKCTVEEVNFVIYPKDTHTKQAFEEEVKLLKDGGQKRQKFSVQFNNVHVEMVIEDIAAQKVDAILCSTSDDFDLSRSGAAQALLKAGGKTLQEKANVYKQSGLQSGQVGKISAGNLPCKAVFLTRLPSFSQENIQVLRKAVQSFLQTCNSEKYTSVAMPAMGTGFLKYPKPMVSKTMFEAVQSWANSTQASVVKSVRFVMYAKDYEVIQAFKSQIQTFTGGSVRKGRNFKRQVSKKDSQQSQKYTMFDSGCRIGGITLTVKVGDIVMEKADAIVSSVGKPCEFLGAVAQSILKKCPQMKQTCEDKKHKLEKNSILGTRTDRGLPSGYVIHVHFQESLRDWQNIVQKCLEKANNKGFRSLAFPVLGTGQGTTTFRPEEIAGCIFDAINNFAFKNIPGNRKLKDVRLIIFDKQHTTKHPIMRAIESKTKSTKDSKGVIDKVKGFLSGAKAKVVRTFSSSTGTEAENVEKADSSISLTIYSDSKTNIDKCKKELDETLDGNYMKKTIDNFKEIVKSLSPDELKEFEGTQQLVDIKIDQSNGIITIFGPSRNVSDAHSEALNKLRSLETHRRSAEEAKTLYTLVKWHHEDITADGTTLEAYDEMSNLTIETAYKDGKAQVELEDTDKEVYIIQFANMVEYLAKNQADQVRVVRKDIINAGDAIIPTKWATMLDQENIKMVTLQQSGQEYKDIETTFVNGVKSGQFANRIPNVQNIAVTKIERIQNRTLYQQYIAKKEQMEIDKPNLPQQFQPMEKILWHGTSGEAVASIQRHGFNRSYCGKNGIWYGAGVYFSNDASYSARPWLAMGQQNPTKPPGQNKGYIFMCKVLTGQYLQGNNQMRYLPPIDPNKSKTLMYDSSVDNVQNPKEFAIYHDTQAYPEYIITFNV